MYDIFNISTSIPFFHQCKDGLVCDTNHVLYKKRFIIMSTWGMSKDNITKETLIELAVKYNELKNVTSIKKLYLDLKKNKEEIKRVSREI